MRSLQTAIRTYGPSLLVLALIIGLAAWRLTLVRVGPDPDSDSYGHHAIARQILADPSNLTVHWVWLPLFHYLQAVIILLGGNLETVRFLDVALWTAVPAILFAWLLTREMKDQEPSLRASLPPLAAALFCALAPIGMQMGTTAQPEPLFCLLVLGFVVAMDRKAYPAATLLLGAAAMLRYEAWATLAATGAWLLFRAWRTRTFDRKAWMVVAFPVFLIVAWTIARRIADHTWFFFLTQTHAFASDAMKGSLSGGGVRALASDLALYSIFIPWRAFGPALVLVPLGFVRAWRTKGPFFFLAYLAALAFLTLSWMTRSMLGLERHVVVLVPFLSILAADGLTQIAELLAKVHRARFVPYVAYGLAAAGGAVVVDLTWDKLGDWMHEWGGALEHGWPDREATGAFLRTAQPKPDTIFCDEGTVEVLSGIDRHVFDRRQIDRPGSKQRILDEARTGRAVYVATWWPKTTELRPLGEVVYRPPGADDKGLVVLRIPRPAESTSDRASR